MQRKGDTNFSIFQMKNVPLNWEFKEVKEQVKELLLFKM